MNCSKTSVQKQLFNKNCLFTDCTVVEFGKIIHLFWNDCLNSHKNKFKQRVISEFVLLKVMNQHFCSIEQRWFKHNLLFKTANCFRFLLFDGKNNQRKINLRTKYELSISLNELEGMPTLFLSKRSWKLQLKKKSFPFKLNIIIVKNNSKLFFTVTFCNYRKDTWDWLWV